MTDRFRSAARTFGATAIILMLALLGQSASALAGSGADGGWRSGPVLSDDEVAAATGKSIEQWGAEWWQWAFNNPDVLGDTTENSGRSAMSADRCSLRKGQVAVASGSITPCRVANTFCCP